MAAEGANVSVEPKHVALGWRNWANLGAYVLNSAITYSSIFGAFGPDNSSLSAKYQLLITPAGFAFSIWGPIFIWEGVFAVAQMFPRYRAATVVELATPGWLVACSCQVLWTLVFAQEWILFALLCMLGILSGLIWIAVSTDGLAMTWSEYFVLRGGFSLHLGWIIAASALNANVLADSAKASPGTLLGLAITSIGIVCVLASCFALVPKSADPVVCLVAAWAFNGIRVKLANPTELDASGRYNPHTWDRVTLEGLQLATLLVSFLALALAVVAIARVALGMRRSMDTQQHSADIVPETEVMQEA